MKKLLVAFPSRERGGAEGYALTVARAAAQRGWEVHVACPRVPGTESLIDDFLSAGARHHPTWLTEARFGFARHVLNLLEALRLLLSVRPSVVLLVQPWITDNFASMVACAALRRPAVAVFQLAPTPARLAPWRRRLLRWAMARGQRWVAVSHHNRRIICETYGCGPESVQVIPNGVEILPPDALPSQEEARQEVGRELDLPGEARLVLTVGRLEEQKGYDVLLEALPTVVAAHPRARFLWVGEGKLRGRLESRLAELDLADRVYLLGHRTDVPRLLAAAERFVFPTRFEGFPFAVLEAMAAGLPVVASDASSLPEVIVDGEHGRLFKSGDPADLATKLVACLADEHASATLAANGRERASTFSVDRMVRSTLSLLETVGASCS